MVMQVKYVFIVRIIRAEDEKKGIDSPSKVSLISKESELHHSIGSLIGGAHPSEEKWCRRE